MKLSETSSFRSKASLRFFGHALILIAFWAQAGFSQTPLEQAIDNALAVIGANASTVYRMLPYGVNLAKLVEPLPNLQKQIAQNGASQHEINGISAEYPDEVEWEENEKGKASFLKSVHESLDKLPMMTLETVEVDFLKIKTQQEGTAFLWLIPFLYEENGNAKYSNTDETVRKKIIDEIEQEPMSSIMKRYLTDNIHFYYTGQDFTDALEKANQMIRFGQFNRGLTEILISRIERMKQLLASNGARTSKTTLNQIRTKIIFLEEMVPIQALARSVYAADCGTSCLPYYPLLKHAYVFKAMSAGSRNKIATLGYFVVLEVQEGNSTVPYVLSVSGRMSTNLIGKYLQLIAARWNAESIFLGDVDHNPRLIDNDEIRAEISNIPGNEATISDIPFGWEVIDAWVARALPQIRAQIGVPDYENVYQKSLIARAKRVSVSDLALRDSATALDSPRTFSFPIRLDQQHRATLAAQFIIDHPDANPDMVMQKLDLPLDKQHRAILAAQFIIAHPDANPDVVVRKLDLPPGYLPIGLVAVKAALGQNVSDDEISYAQTLLDPKINAVLFRPSTSTLDECTDLLAKH